MLGFVWVWGFFNVFFGGVVFCFLFILNNVLILNCDMPFGSLCLFCHNNVNSCWSVYIYIYIYF